MVSELKKKIEEAKTSFDELPGGWRAVSLGFIIGAAIAFSCFFNIWLGIGAMAAVAVLFVLNMFGIDISPEKCVVVAAALIGVTLTLVLSLAFLLLIHGIQALVLLFI